MLALLLVAFASVRIVSTYNVFSQTSDEPMHVAAGMEWLDRHVYQWEPQHPPLARVAAALGPYLLGLRSQNLPHRLENFPVEGTRILGSGGNVDLALGLARAGILPFFWAACFVVFAWGRRYFGAAVAVAALFLFTFEPTVLAHAGLATTDMAATAFLGATFLAGAMFLEEPTRAHAAWFGVAGGLAILSKFSVLAFFPAAAGAALLWYFIAEKPGAGATVASIRARLPGLLISAAVALVIIWAGYRFSFGKVWFANVKLPAPELFQGIKDVADHNAEGHPAYLLGQRSHSGFWDFFPVAIAVKTPLAYLALLVVGLTVALRRNSSWKRASLAVAFSAAILAVGMGSNINIGLRHILPIYLSFSLLAGVGLVYLLNAARSMKWAHPLAAVLIGWLSISSLAAHPDYIPYFNEIVGSRPEYFLVDSDLDWGQDMKRLATRLREAGAQQLILVSHFKTDYEHLGFPPVSDVMDVVRPQSGWTAVSITVLKQRRMGLGDGHPDITPWPDLIPPMERIGKSLWLYHFARTGAVQ